MSTQHQKYDVVELGLINGKDKTTTSTTSIEDEIPEDEAAVERKKLMEDPGHTSLIRPLLIQLIPVGITVAVVQLSFRSVYFFDMKGTASTISYNKYSIGVNELLKCLQFLAKIHEIVLLTSLSTIVLHFVRLKVGGDFMFTTKFWKAGKDRAFWKLGIFLILCAIVANILGPASAIALVPSLSWWPVKAPFGHEFLPVGIEHNSTELWPMKLSKPDLPYQNETITTHHGTTYACGTSVFEGFPACPGSGWNNIHLWTKAYAHESVAANVTILNSRSNSQRVIQSRLASWKGLSGGPAIATSLSSSFTTLISSLWQFIGTTNFPINHISRPRLKIPKRIAVLQPLVQVQCSQFILNQFSIESPKPTNYSSVTVHADLINKLMKSENQVSHTWTIPKSFDKYKYTIKTENLSHPEPVESLDFMWVDLADQDKASASIGAIVITPYFKQDGNNSASQGALAHACTVDARWAATEPVYDPAVGTVIQHNLTDTLLFQKSNPSASGDSRPWGLSPVIAIDPSWAESLNLDMEMDNVTAKAIPWLLEPFIILGNASELDPEVKGMNDTQFYEFSPVYNLAANSSALEDINNYVPVVSDTVATVLSVLITDALARVANDKEYVVGQENPGTFNTFKTTSLLSFGGENLLGNKSQVIMSDTEFNLRYPTNVFFEVDRYGYGYGLHGAAVQFGVAFLLLHTFISLWFIGYTVYTFYFGDKWTSGALCTMPELSAVVMKSELAMGLKE